MPPESFFVRRAKSLMRRPAPRLRFDLTHLEDRVTPAVAGTVFQDYNVNGALDTTTTVPNDGIGTIRAAIDGGVGNVTVTAFDASGAKVGQTTTAANGTYSVPTPGAGNYRIEFTGLPAGFTSGPHGATSQTAVQFAADGATGVNYGVVRASDYFTDNPLLLTNRYLIGDQAGALPAGPTFIPAGVIDPAGPVIVSFPYSAGTTDQSDPVSGARPVVHEVAIRADNVGTTWGLGFDRGRDRAFASAFTKRHTGWGPGGAGTIYTFDLPSAANPSVTTATAWFNLPGIGGALATTRQGYTNQDGYATDGGNVGWDAVGKTSYGGLDVNDAGTQLYVMNLFDRSLYVITINPDGTAGAATPFVVPVPSNATGLTAGNPLGDVRPFAVEFHEGLVYVGMVNSAETTQQASDLRAYVYTFDPATNTWGTRSVLNESAAVEGVSLDYDKRMSYGGPDRYLPWSPTFQDVRAIGGQNSPAKYPQPMLSGIAFDRSGNMVLGLRDRNGDQTGRFLPSDPANPTIALEGISSGDILRAFLATPGNLASGWALEQNAANPNNPAQVGTGPGNSQGPGGGEFFAQDGFGGSDTNGDGDVGHRDVAVGGVAQIPGFPSVATTAFDPLRGGPFRSGGVRWFDATAGLLEKSYLIYNTDAGNNTFGKANGLGDLLAVEPQDPPIEVGNRLFRDDNRNGVQDANEPAVGGVTVQLWSADGVTKFAEVTTGADGSYYFNSGAAPGKAAANEAYGVAALTPGGKYQVRIPNALGPVGQQAALSGLILTAAFADKTANGTARDSDAVTGADGTTAVLALDLTGAVPGQSNHAFDAGFTPGLTLGDFVWEDLNNNGTLDAGEAGIDGVAVRLYADANGDKAPDGAALGTTTTAGGGKYLFTGLPPGKYLVEIVAPAGYRSSTGTALDPVNGPFESALIGNSNNDNEDHGRTVGGDILSGFVIRANTVTLTDPSLPGNVNPDKTAGSTANDANLRQDFGLYRGYGLGNRVWLDKNNNGTIDAADGPNPGIDGVTVRLYRPADFVAGGDLINGAVPLRTTTTAGGGYYRFDDLLGSTAANPAQGLYVVVVGAANGPLAGLRSSTGGSSITTLFEPPPSAIPPTGTTDSDDNATTVGGGLARAGVTILGPGANAPTGEADLIAGVNPQGTLDAQGDMTVDFGFYRPLSLGNQVWNDANNNGLLDAGEAGIDGVSVSVFRADAAGNPVGAAIETQTTKSGGFYLFTGLGADNYVVQVDGKTLPAGFWLSSSGQNGSAAGRFEPGADPNADPRDGIDRGTTLQQDAAAYTVRSKVVTLAAGTAPTGEAPTQGFADPAPDADSNATIDFGFYQPLSIGNRVWNDVNNSGTVDAADGANPGIDGVTVRVYQDNGDGVFDPATDAKLGEQQTKGGGYYLFGTLAPGGYFVEIVTPAGFVSSTGTPGKATGPFEPGTTADTDDADHGTMAGAVIRSGLVTLSVGGEPTGEPATPGFADPDPDANANYTVDFGVYQSLQIGNLVWNDADNNGLFDAANEAGIAGVAVDLLDAAGAVLQSTTTDASGNYLFRDLSAGDYQVRITPPAGFASSTGANGNLAAGPFEPGRTDNTDDADHGTTVGGFVVASKITLGPAGSPGNPDGGTANLRQDFGLFRPLSLGNFVWDDANNNGAFDPGESPLQGVTVMLLDAGGNPVSGTQTTDANGNYLFTGLTPGSYTVRVTTPAGFMSSTGKNGSATGPFEPGVADNTDNADHGTAAGPFTASAVVLAAPGNAANPDAGGTANLRQDFGFFRPLSLGNFAWNDANNSGKLDAGETGLANVAVTLLDAVGTTVGTTATDGSGNYLFTNLAAGDYTVRITPPAGFVTSTGANGSATGPYEPGVGGTQDNEDHGTAAGVAVESKVTLAAAGSPTNPDNAGLANLRQDFGLFQPIKLGNTVFVDPNNNGLLDAGEAGVSNVTVRLLDPAGNVVATTTTDANGMYMFPNVTPGKYVVELAPPTGARPSTPVFDPLTGDQRNIGTAVGTTIRSPVLDLQRGGAPLVGGNADPNSYVSADFGLLALAQVSGFTYLDVNRNGTYDPTGGDKAIPTVTVTLTGTDDLGNPVTRTTVSDGTGFYQFTQLPSGKYTITETQPPGTFFQGTDNVGSLGGTNPAVNTLTVTLVPNDNGQRYNFGEVLPGALFGYVWVDLNRNCQKDANEPVLAGVPVTLSGTVFAGTPSARPLTAADVPGGALTILTDANGRYQFPVLPPGTYAVSRGTLPATAAGFADWCLQNGDPSGPTPGFGPNQFSNVTLTPSTRGPLNFGVVPTGAVTGTDATKREFLGSTDAAVSPPTTVPPPGGPTRGPVSLDPSFATTTGTPTRPAYVVAATGAGVGPVVRVFDYATGFERFRLTPYEASFTGGVRAATGDVTGDGVADVVTVTGPGGGPRIRVFDGVTGAPVRDFFAFESTFRGGAFVAVGDVNGDGRGDVIVGAEVGGGPRVTVFDGATGNQLANFFAFDANQRGGVRVAAADFNADGRADIVATTGTGVPTQVRVLDGTTQAELAAFSPFESSFTGGVNLAVGDYNGDGRADIITGAEVGGGPRLQVFDGRTFASLANMFAFESSFTGGVRVAAQDVNGDGKADLVATPGPGGSARVRVLRSGDLQPLDDFFAYDPEFTGGAYVG